MEKQTINQGAEVAQVVASTTPTIKSNAHTLPLPPYLMSHIEQITEIISRFGATEYLARLQEMDFEYKELLYAIDAGGLLERDPAEDPAEVLADLRINYTPTPRQLAERANLLRCMGDLLSEVEAFVRQFKALQIPFNNDRGAVEAYNM